MPTPTLVTVVGDLAPSLTVKEVEFVVPVRVHYNAGPDVIVRHKVTVEVAPDGTFTTQLYGTNDPAWSPSNWNYKVTLIGDDIVDSFYVQVPYNAGSINFSALLPALTPSEGTLYAAYAHSHGGGGGAPTWAEITGKPSTFPPETHSHPQSEVTGLVVALAGKSDTGHSHGGGGGTSMVVKRAKITSGNVTPQVAGAFATLTGGPTLAIPAVVGDYVEFNAMGMRSLPAASQLDIVVLVAGNPVRYSATNTGTPALEGDPELYPNPGEFLGMTTRFEFVVEAGDISGGNVTFGFATKSNGTGTLYASNDYPLRLRAVNYGAVSVS